MDKSKFNEFPIQIKSKVHPHIYHMAYIDLYCYEKMPNEKQLKPKAHKSLYCYERLFKEKELDKTRNK